MDTKVKLVFLIVATAVNAGLVAVAPQVLEGPSSRTILVGPDGSQISALLPGGKILLDGNLGPVLQAAPAVIATPAVAHSIPVVNSPILVDALPAAVAIKTIPDVILTNSVVAAAPVSAETKPDTEAVSVEAAAVKSAPEKNEATEATSEAGVTEAASTEAPKAEEKSVSEETAAVAETTSSNSTSTEATSEAAAAKPAEGSAELDGKYIPDNIEKQYDDGSYKPDPSGW